MNFLCVESMGMREIDSCYDLRCYDGAMGPGVRVEIDGETWIHTLPLMRQCFAFDFDFDFSLPRSLLSGKKRYTRAEDGLTAGTDGATKRIGIGIVG